MFAGQSERYVKEGSTKGQLSLHRDPLEERGGGGHFIRDIEIQTIEGSGSLAPLSLSLSGSSTRVTWRDVSFTGKSEIYVRHVKEGFGNGASLSFDWLRERNVEAALLY